MLEQDKLSELTKEKYEELLNEAIRYYDSKQLSDSYILPQLLDIKKYIVDQRIYQCMSEDDIWEECDQKYSFGGYAAKNLDDDNKEYNYLTTLYYGAIQYEFLPDNKNNQNLILRKTYLNDNVKNDRLTRWNKSIIPVYIPSVENIEYRNSIIQAFELWSKAANGNVIFEFANEESKDGINIIFREFNKNAPYGYFENSFSENNQIFGSKIELCLPNLQIYKNYTNENLYKIALCLIGCSLGLPNSPYTEDATYKHREGYLTLSARDKSSIKWLYSIPQNITISDFAISKGLNSDFSIDDIIARLDNTDNDEVQLREKGKIVSTPQKPLLAETNSPFAIYENVINQKEHLDLETAERMADEMIKTLKIRGFTNAQKDELENYCIQFVLIAEEKGSKKYKNYFQRLLVISYLKIALVVGFVITMIAIRLF